MNKKNTIIITGAAGFIGSYLTGYLNKKGFENLVLVDEFDTEEKELNLHQKKYLVRVERENLFEWLEKEKPAIDFVFHIGARTDTTEFDYNVHEKLNVAYSKSIWDYCTAHKVPLVYASSAATYGMGESGFKDDHDIVEKLQPLNPYGVSKNEFDKWALRQAQDGALRQAQDGALRSFDKLRTAQAQGPEQTPPFWAGLKFFNVYGPNEYHKGRMASMVFHGFNQIQKNGKVKLFRSHRPDYKDGEQLRDFIYVADIAAVCFWLLDQPAVKSGLYNLGSGKARSFNDLIHAIYKSLNIPSDIEYIDTPADIRDKYQYFTEADMHKLREAGYVAEFCSIEKGVNDYVANFLSKKAYY